jgi:TonB family protein
MPKAWKEWEGQLVSEFRLGEYLGGTERAGVFLTAYGPESRKVAVKLIPVGTWDAATIEAELSRLNTARELSHPHLLRIFQTGRANVEDMEFLFTVMEYAEEDLSQILPTRPLQAEEVREILKPTLDTLGYLHEKGLVHGALKPANVMAIGDDLKLSSDGIRRVGEKRGLPGESSDGDPPESAWGESSAASDIWSLGMLLVVAFTQQLPRWDASGDEPILAENAPPPFGDVARHCLRRDPRARWSLGDIAARLGFENVAESKGVLKQDLPPTRAAARAAVGSESAAPQQKAISGNFRYKRGSNAWGYIAAAVVLVIVAILVGPRLFRSRSTIARVGDSQTSDSETGRSRKGDSPTGKLPKDLAAQRRPKSEAAKPARENAEIAQVSDAGAGGEALRTANSTAVSGKLEDLSGTRSRGPRRGLTTGQVAHQVVPDVPKSARETIRGTVRVGVRISVDSAGNVTDAELDPAGPSKYFAQLALEAAQQWQFDPPKVEGRNVLSDWLLQFQFTGQGTKVIPAQSAP